jgi:hypothetical protein
MKLRIPFVCVLGLTAAILAQPGHARSMGIDESTCPTALAPTGKLWIQLPGTGKAGNRARAGVVNFPVLNCSPPLGLPTVNLSQLPYDPTHSLMYTFVDLAVAGVAGDTLQDVLTKTSSSSGLASLFGFALNDTNETAALVAQIAVLKLNQGGYEVIFNYQSDGVVPTTACLNVFKPIAPSLTWFKTTYLFTGVGGVATPCDSTNDFVFGPTGLLVGYIDDTHTLIAGALPPGWAIK